MNPRKDGERSRLNTLLTRIAPLGYGMPNSIRDSEKPDFILEFGNRAVGIEITLAVEGEYVRAEKLYPDECIIITNLKDRMPRRSNREIAQEIRSHDAPWKSSDEEMTDWQEKVGKNLQAKRKKLNKSDFRIFDDNWLLIYDFPSLANDVDTYNQARQRSADLFSKPQTVGKDFDTVFIYSDRYLFIWSGNKLTLHYDHS